VWGASDDLLTTLQDVLLGSWLARGNAG